MNCDSVRVALREIGIVARVTSGREGNFAVVTSGLTPSFDNYHLVAGIVRRGDPTSFVKVTFTPGEIQEPESLQRCFKF